MPLRSVEALRGIIDIVPHPIFVKDRSGKFLIVNNAMCRFMGHSFEELVGKSDSDFVPQEQAALYRDGDLRALAGESLETEEPFTQDSGELRTILTVRRQHL